MTEGTRGSSSEDLEPPRDDLWALALSRKKEERISPNLGTTLTLGLWKISLLLTLVNGQ